MKLLTPQETLQAIADGVKLEYKWSDNSEWKDFDPTGSSISIESIFKGFFVFRLLPEMITIGDVSFPKPETSPLKLGTVYWYVDLLNTDLFLIDTWDNIEEDYHRLAIGSIHLTKENAITHAKALIQLSGGNVDE